MTMASTSFAVPPPNFSLFDARQPNVISREASGASQKSCSSTRRRLRVSMTTNTPPDRNSLESTRPEHQREQQVKEESQQPDIIERLYRFFFGEKAAAPFGLARFDRDRFPELYPATLTEFAPPHPSDTLEIAAFRPLLARTQLEKRELCCVYDATVHGWTASSFHNSVDRKGASVVLAQTKGGAVVGGYNPKGWVGYGESRGSVAAFLFTWPNGASDRGMLDGRRAIKLRKVGKAALAVIDNPEEGPRFGADALVVPLKPPRATWKGDGGDRICRSKLGSYYERMPDGRDCLFRKGESGKGTELVELKVYSGVYGEGEEIPFSDAVPFALE